MIPTFLSELQANKKMEIEGRKSFIEETHIHMFGEKITSTDSVYQKYVSLIYCRFWVLTKNETSQAPKYLACVKELPLYGFGLKEVGELGWFWERGRGVRIAIDE